MCSSSAIVCRILMGFFSAFRQIFRKKTYVLSLHEVIIKWRGFVDGNRNPCLVRILIMAFQSGWELSSDKLNALITFEERRCCTLCSAELLGKNPLLPPELKKKSPQPLSQCFNQFEEQTVEDLVGPIISWPGKWITF
jgi:hypothetical protein